MTHLPTCSPRCNIAHARIALEDRVIRHMLRTMKRAGWNVTSVTHVEKACVTTERSIIEETKVCDVCWIRFYNGRISHSVLVIRGNGIDCLSDYTVREEESDFDALMCKVYDKLETFA